MNLRSQGSTRKNYECIHLIYLIHSDEQRLGFFEDTPAPQWAQTGVPLGTGPISASHPTSKRDALSAGGGLFGDPHA